jgi:hypothetical protein
MSVDSGKRHVPHFPKVQLLSVRGFWSLTMHDRRRRFTFAEE